MPRFPIYEDEQRLDIGQAPQIQANDQVAQAIQKLGLTVQQVADHWVERKAKQAAFQASTRLDQHKAALEAEYQAYKQNAPADGIGLHDGWMAQASARDKAFLGSLTPQQQADIKPRLAAGTEAWGQRAAEDEVATGKVYETGVLQADLANWQKRLTADPASFDQARDALFGKIDQAISLGTVGRAAMKSEAQAGLARAWWLTRYGDGQPGGGEALGRGPRSTPGATRGIGGDPAGPGLAETGAPAMAQTIRAAASQLGTTPQDLATVIAYETIGRFSPSIKGGKGNNYLGLIQFGPEERHKYGVFPGQSFDEQMGSVVAFLKDRGFRPGMGLLDLYSTINAGSPGRYNASDGHGTVRDHVARMSREQQANVARILGEGGDGMAPTAPSGDAGETGSGGVGGDAAPGDAATADSSGSSRAIPNTAPSSAAPAAIDPRLQGLSEDVKDELLDSAGRNANRLRAEGQQAQLRAQASLDASVQDAATALMTTGSYDGPLPSQSDFLRAKGVVGGAGAYAAFQRTRAIGRQIDAIKMLSPAGQDQALEAIRPSGSGPDFAAQRDQYGVLQEAVAANRKARSEDPNGYVATVYPEIGQLWAQAGNSPEGMKAAISATSAAMTRLGIPVEEQRLLPKAMVSKAVAAFGETARPMAERLAPLRSALSATRDRVQQQAMFDQFVKAGFPPMLEYAAIAYTRGDKPAGDAFARAALGVPNASAGGKNALSPGVTGAPSSPAAAANAPGSPTPLRSLSGPSIDLGPSTQQAFGSSLTGDPRVVRTDILRNRMIDDATQLNGGDRAGAIATVDGYFTSVQQSGGWMPGRYMSAPMAGGGTQYALRNTTNNPNWPGATSSPDQSPAPPNSNSAGGPLARMATTGARSGGLGIGAMGAVGGAAARLTGAITRAVIHPTMIGPSYADAPLPQYYTVGSDYGSAIILPAATIKQVQALNTYLKASERGGSNYPELAQEHAPYIQASFDLGVRNALMKLRGMFSPSDGDTYAKGTLDATKVVSGNGWEFKFRPPTYPGAPLQIIAARLAQTGREDPENQWENLEDPNNPSARLQASLKPDDQYAKDYNEALQKTLDFGEANRIAEARYYDRQRIIRSGQGEEPPNGSQDPSGGKPADATVQDGQDKTLDIGPGRGGGSKKPPRGDGDVAPPPEEPGRRRPPRRLHSTIVDSSYAVRLAEGLSTQGQEDVDNIIAQYEQGNDNPGIGSKPVGGGFTELRGRNGGRAIVVKTGENQFDIVGKFQGHARGDNRNSEIIKKLIANYLARKKQND